MGCARHRTARRSREASPPVGRATCARTGHAPVCLARAGGGCCARHSLETNCARGARSEARGRPPSAPRARLRPRSCLGAAAWPPALPAPPRPPRPARRTKTSKRSKSLARLRCCVCCAAIGAGILSVSDEVMRLAKPTVGEVQNQHRRRACLRVDELRDATTFRRALADTWSRRRALRGSRSGSPRATWRRPPIGSGPGPNPPDPLARTGTSQQGTRRESGAPPASPVPLVQETTSDQSDQSDHWS